MGNIFKGKLVKPNAQLFLSRVIEPVLCSLPGITNTPSASQLLLGTAIKESGNFKYRRQIGGPAVSYFQIEPETHKDILESYLKFRPVLKKAIIGIMSKPEADPLDELVSNDSYAAAIARIKYQRCPEKLPVFDDGQAMARYWKKYYNTPLGKGTVKSYMDMWDMSVSKQKLIYSKVCV